MIRLVRGLNHTLELAFGFNGDKKTSTHKIFCCKINQSSHSTLQENFKIKEYWRF